MSKSLIAFLVILSILGMISVSFHRTTSLNDVNLLATSRKNLPRLAVGIVTAPRQPPELPRIIASRIMANVDKNITDMFIQQAYSAANNVEDREEFTRLGFETTFRVQDYPELSQTNVVPTTWGNSQERVIWRTREALDYIHLLEYMYQKSTADIFAVIEDDAFASQDFGPRLVTAIAQSTLNWSYIPLYTREMHHNTQTPLNSIVSRDFGYLYCGSVAIAFHRRDIPGFVEYVRKDIFKDPIDWAIFTYFDKTKVKPALFLPSLFQHVGDISTFLNKPNPNLRARSFITHIDPLIQPYSFDKAGYIGCFQLQIDGFHYSHGPRSPTGLHCAVGCLGYRFYAMMQDQPNCVCTNEPIKDVRIQDCSCPIANGTRIGVGERAAAVYTTGLSFQRKGESIYFDLKSTVGLRKSIEQEFKRRDIQALKYSALLRNKENWTSNFHAMAVSELYFV